MIFLAAAAITMQLPALSVTDANPLDSPLGAVSYWGRFSDVFSNPAALPLMETEPGPFALSVSWADDYRASDFGSIPMPLLKAQHWSMSASFIARNIALTAFFPTDFSRLEQAVPEYDIHSGLRIEVDMAYALPHFSIGMRLSGGNRMIRQSKRISDLGDVFANAWFSPFEREGGSESFDVGIGTIVYAGPVSLGIYVGELLTLRDDSLYFGLDALAESTTISLAVGAGRFTSTGDLRFFRPRASVSMTGLVEAATRSIEAEAELTFQFLPESSASIGASYLEQHHEILRFNPADGYVNIFLRGEGAGFSVTAGVTFSAVDFSSFAPSITFSYVS